MGRSQRLCAIPPGESYFGEIRQRPVDHAGSQGVSVRRDMMRDPGRRRTKIEEPGRRSRSEGPAVCQGLSGLSDVALRAGCPVCYARRRLRHLLQGAAKAGVDRSDAASLGRRVRRERAACSDARPRRAGWRHPDSVATIVATFQTLLRDRYRPAPACPPPPDIFRAQRFAAID